jgi:hypothetical protein
MGTSSQRHGRTRRVGHRRRRVNRSANAGNSPQAAKLRWTKSFHSLIGSFVNEKSPPHLDDELLLFEQKLPRFFSGFVDWVRRPTSRLIRLPLGILLVLFGIFGFLPIVGFWMIPLGLLLIARDVPALEPPLARLLAWINRKWPGKSAEKTDQPPR